MARGKRIRNSSKALAPLLVLALGGCCLNSTLISPNTEEPVESGEPSESDASPADNSPIGLLAPPEAAEEDGQDATLETVSPGDPPNATPQTATSGRDDTPSEPSAAPTGTPAPDLLHPVLDVIDGDTVRLEIDGASESVRLIGIDAPETSHPQLPVQCFGREATDYARQLLDGASVRLETDLSQDIRDRCDRLLAYLWLEDGTLVNEQLIAEGYAFEYTYNAPFRYRSRFLSAEEVARSEERGLWSPHTCDGIIGNTASVSSEDIGTVQKSDDETLDLMTDTVADGSDVNVEIRYIFNDGEVYRVESDEYAEIVNRGSVPVSLAGWRLNAGNPGQDFNFPDFTIEPGQAYRTYTNEVHMESCGFSFGNGQALWNNDGDCGYLFDASGTLVSEYCYR